MKELTSFLQSDGGVDPQIVNYVTQELQLESVSDFANFWTRSEYEMGVQTDIVEKIKCFKDTTSPMAKLQIARLRTAWKESQQHQNGKVARTPEAPKQVCIDAGAKTPALSEPLLSKNEKSGLETATQDAAWALERALFRKGLPELAHDAVSARKCHSKVLTTQCWYARGVMGLLFLSFFEVPAWCYTADQPNLMAWVSGTEWCASAGGSNVILSNVSYMPASLGLGLELALLSLVLCSCVAERALEAPGAKMIASAAATLAVGGILDVIIFIAFRNPVRLSFLFRSGLLVLLPNIRSMLENIFNYRVLAEVGSVMFFLLGTIVMFAFIVMTLLRSNDSVAYSEDGEVVRASKGFEAFGESMYSMFVTAGTGDFMDILLPSFTVFHSSALLWMAYMVLTKVLLRNMVLDTIISQYMKSAEEVDRSAADAQASSMKRAHSLLANGMDMVPKDIFISFVAVLQQSGLWAPLSADAADLLYESTGGMTRESFIGVCAILQGKVWVTQDPARLGKLDDAFSRSWQRFIKEPQEKPTLDSIMDKVLLLNLVLMVVESTYDVMKWEEASWMGKVELVFALAYLTECCLKLSVRTFHSYWSDFGNRFDFFTTWVLLFTSLLPYLPFVSTNLRLSHYANILRLFRLFRVMKELKRSPTIQFMFKAVTRIVVSGRNLLLLMGLFLFFFCGACVNFFGGILYEGNPKLEGTEYAESHWFVLNFNDMFMAALSMFFNLLTEFMPALAEAISKASSWPNVSWWIMIVFYVVVSSVMLDLLVAFTVQVYVAMKEENFEEVDEEEEEDMPVEESEVSTRQDEKALEDAMEEEADNEEKFQPAQFFEQMQDQLAESGRVVHWNAVVLRAFDDEVHENYAEYLALERRGKSTFQIQQGSQRERVCRAAWMTMVGVLGNRPQEGWDKQPDIVGAWGSYIQALAAEQSYDSLMALLVMLTFVETPFWCRVSNEERTWRGWAFMSGDQRCPAPHAQANLYLSGIPYIPPGLGLGLELALLIAVARSFLFQRRVGDRHAANVGLVFVILNFADAVSPLMVDLNIRFTFIFRTALLFSIPDVRRYIGSIFNRKMLGELLFTAQVFILAVLLFAWIAYTLLRDSNDTAYVKKGENVKLNEGFETLSSAIYTMFTAAISESFVDSFMPTMNTLPAYGLLWSMFLLLTQVLLLNLVIDTFVSAYLEASEKETDRTAKSEASALMQAFKTLAPADQPITDQTILPKDVVVDWTEELGRCPRYAHLSRGTVWALLESFGDVTMAKFCDMNLLMKCNVQVTEHDSILKEAAPMMWGSEWHKQVQSFVLEPSDAPKADQFFELVLMLNLVLIVAQFQFESSAPAWMSVASVLFTVAYVLECILKLSVRSFEEYWMSGANRFDFVTTTFLFGTTVLSMLPDGAVQAKLAQYSNVLRLMRLLRVFRKLGHLKSFQFMLNTMVRMFCAAKTILCTLGIVLLGFTMLCTNCLGGLIYEGNAALDGSDMSEKHWTVFNFNDIPMGFFTWFTQLLNGYSTELADALSRVSPLGELAWWVVPGFYVVAVNVTFQILTAFTIELFLSLKEEAELAEGNETEEEEEEEEQGDPRETIILKEMQAKLGETRTLHSKVWVEPAFQKQLMRQYAKECSSQDDK